MQQLQINYKGFIINFRKLIDVINIRIIYLTRQSSNTLREVDMTTNYHVSVPKLLDHPSSIIFILFFWVQSKFGLRSNDIILININFFTPKKRKISNFIPKIVYHAAIASWAMAMASH